jgi:ribosomal protein S18 acetylase RimI-like enzyme
MGVHIDQRGRGIGSQLLAELLTRARAAGLERVSLSVETDNPARNLYQRAGFVPVGRSGGAETMVWTSPS